MTRDPATKRMGGMILGDKDRVWVLKGTIGRFCASLLALCSMSGCAAMAYQHMNDPSRDAWQRPKEVVEKLALTPGAHVADLGAGGGYFTWYLAGAVGSQGTVYAVEIDQTALRIIDRDMRARGMMNVKPI